MAVLDTLSALFRGHTEAAAIREGKKGRNQVTGNGGDKTNGRKALLPCSRQKSDTEVSIQRGSHQGGRRA